MIIDVKSLRKEFSIPSGTAVAVDGIDLTIEEGEFVSLVGPSGCGKTTTLRCIAGLETPTEGTIQINGEDATEVPANKRRLAMMFQNIALYPHMSVRENIAYPLKVKGVPEEERHEKAAEGAEIMQIPELLDKYPGELSGGQRQRAALARTVVQNPDGFLMDEPLSDLDAKLKIEIRKEIQRVHKRVGKPTLYVTHDQEEAMTMSDRIAVMNDGQIEQIGTPDELYDHPTNQFVARFIGNPTINFLEGTIENLTSDSAQLSLYGQEFDLSLEYVDAEPQSSEIVVGVRPEDITLAPYDGDGVRATVSLVERISDRILVTLDGPDGEIRMTLPADTVIEEGEDVKAEIDKERVYLFDPESTDLVAWSSKSAGPEIRRTPGEGLS